MIKIKLNTDEFEYDIRSMVKAFYPEEYLFLDVKESKSEPQKEKEAGEITFCMEVNTWDEKIELSIDEGTKQYHQKETVKEPRIKRKNDLKQLLYQVFSQRLEKELPWGTLTGIRPTKLITKGILEQKDKEEIREQMKKDYLISDKKYEMGYEIACKELSLLQKIPEERGYSLYVSVPFCPSICLYCSFSSFTVKQWEKRLDDYVDALKKELLFLSKEMKNMELNTVYFGGGTPTTLQARHLEELVTFIYQNFDMSHVIEFTVEAGRPDSITKEKLEAMKRAGVNRISINPQTMKQETLDIIGRRHTVEDTVQAFYLARECGFDNINMDLILGLPGERKEDVKETLEKVMELKPDNLTVHSLARKRHSRLNLESERYASYYYDTTEETMDLAEKYARAMGLSPYYLYRQKNMAGNQENVGYAAPNKEGIYNILIMEERQSILAVGAGGITKLVTKPGTLMERVETVKDVNTYLERLDEMIVRKGDALIRCGLKV